MHQLCVVSAPGLVCGVKLCIGPRNQVYAQMRDGQVWSCSARDTALYTTITPQPRTGDATGLAVTMQGRFVTTSKTLGVVAWGMDSGAQTMLSGNSSCAGITAMPCDMFACTVRETHTVRLVCAAMRISWRFAGLAQKGHIDGDRSVARFDSPTGLALAPDGGVLVADTGNHAIRRVSQSGFVQTLEVFEADGKTPLALSSPLDVDADADGWIVVADTGARCLRVVAPDGKTHTVPLPHAPASVAIDENGAVWVLPRECDGIVYRVEKCGTGPGLRCFGDGFSLRTLNMEGRLALGLQLQNGTRITPENATVLGSSDEKAATMKQRLTNFEAFYTKMRAASSKTVEDDDNVVADWLCSEDTEVDSDLDDLCCPITRCIMRDPVLAADNNTYERSAIERWFAKSKTFPLTNQKAHGSGALVLRSNRALKKIIEKRLKERRRKMHARVVGGGSIDVVYTPVYEKK